MSADSPDSGSSGGSDHSLVKRFREGEQDAATELFLKYGARLQALARSQTSRALASRFDPEDVIQSVFRTFFRRAAKGLYDVPEGDELWQLLLVLALNKIRDLAAHHGAQKRDVKRTQDTGEMGGTLPSQSSMQQTSMQTLEVVLDDFLGNLPETQATVARLRMEGYQVDEIAQRTGRSKRTIERILNSLRQHLITRLDTD